MAVTVIAATDRAARAGGRAATAARHAYAALRAFPRCHRFKGPGNLVFRAGRGAVTSAVLEGTSLTARRTGPLTTRHGGGVAYFAALGARHRGTLTVTLADGGRTTPRTPAFGR
ncbi:hypothetical protein [Streptomyces sp. NPDC020917]|uniref:hypothetical protein n=1 Tax=Streptomyces sp. NPDC020917 TaxID=3365102 RepID=UPI00378B4273